MLGSQDRENTTTATTATVGKERGIDMCSICHRIVCPSTCPNADEPKPIQVCEKCGTSLYAGDSAYNIGDHVYCEDCVINAHFEIE